MYGTIKDELYTRSEMTRRKLKMTGMMGMIQTMANELGFKHSATYLKHWKEEQSEDSKNKALKLAGLRREIKALKRNNPKDIRIKELQKEMKTLKGE